MTAQPIQWLPEGLRVTVFFDEKRKPDELVTNVENIFQLEAESFERIKSDNKKTETASLGVGKLTLINTPSRVDWKWQVTVEEDPQSSLGDTEQAVSIFLEPLLGWIKGVEGVSRVAFGGVFKIPMSSTSKEESYEILQKYLHAIKLDWKNSGEFMYQINRYAHRTIRDKQLQCNRISKWFSRSLQTGVLSLSDTGFSMAGDAALTINPLCELDISSPIKLDFTMTPDEAAELLQGLSDYAVDTLRRGDYAAE